MMKRIFAAALTTATLMAAPAFAATLTIGDGQVGCESTNEFGRFGVSQAEIDAICDVGGTADLSNNVNAPSTVDFLGSGVLVGFVLDADGLNNSQYPDYALVTVAEKSEIFFQLLLTDDGFDAAFSFGTESAIVDSVNTFVEFSVDAGTYLFGLNATSPTNNPEAVSTIYALEVNAIAPVPLPAGAVLLLTGLGGLAFARRKQTA